MAQRTLALSTFPERESANAITRLFRAVIAEAVRCDDALDWIATADAALVCALADVEREAVERAILRGDVPRRKAQKMRENLRAERRGGGFGEVPENP